VQLYRKMEFCCVSGIQVFCSPQMDQFSQYHRGIVGDEGLAWDGEPAEQEDLREDRELAEQEAD